VSNGRSSEDLSLIHFLAASWWERFALQFRFEWKSTQRPSPFPYEPLGKEKGRWSFQRPKPIVAMQSKKHRRQKNRPQSSQLRAILSSASFQLTALKKHIPCPSSPVNLRSIAELIPVLICSPRFFEIQRY